jgi:hypothetical protein
MGLRDWNWKQPVVLQTLPWDCAAASLAWCLQACGHPYTQEEVVAGLGPNRISEAEGLLDASGAGIVDWLSTIGVQAENNGNATWEQLLDAAGYQPMLVGGRRWYHWTGVRLSDAFFPEVTIEAIALANPAPGYGNVEQLLLEADYLRLGSWSAVWFVAW